MNDNYLSQLEPILRLLKDVKDVRSYINKIVINNKIDYEEAYYSLLNRIMRDRPKVMPKKVINNWFESNKLVLSINENDIKSNPKSVTNSTKNIIIIKPKENNKKEKDKKESFQFYGEIRNERKRIASSSKNMQGKVNDKFNIKIIKNSYFEHPECFGNDKKLNEDKSNLFHGEVLHSARLSIRDEYNHKEEASRKQLNQSHRNYPNNVCQSSRNKNETTGKMKTKKINNSKQLIENPFVIDKSKKVHESQIITRNHDFKKYIKKGNKSNLKSQRNNDRDSFSWNIYYNQFRKEINFRPGQEVNDLKLSKKEPSEFAFFKENNIIINRNEKASDSKRSSSKTKENSDLKLEKKLNNYEIKNMKKSKKSNYSRMSSRNNSYCSKILTNDINFDNMNLRFNSDGQLGHYF